MQSRNAGLAAAALAALLAMPGEYHGRPAGSLQMAQAEPKGDAARPSRGPASESAVPTNAPAATPEQTTGATDQSGKVKQQNQAEKKKIEAEGK